MLSQMSTLQREVQVALFLHCLDDDALKAYNGFFFLSPELDRSVSDIIAKFDSFVIGEVNETYERFVFNNHAQKDTETFEGFYSDLRRLVKTCNYCDKCLDSILRDRIVQGVWHKDIQGDLLKIHSLTLLKAIDVCKAAENADRHRQTMNMTSQVSTAVNAVTTAKCAYRSAGATGPPTPLCSARCKYCGRQHEMLKSKCPAFGKECGKCCGRNHFASMCKSSRKANVNNLESSDSKSEPVWVNTIHHCPAKLVWCKMIVNQTPVAFLIDSGASVNVLPKRHAKNLIPSTTSLSFGGSSLSCVGKTREPILLPVSSCDM
ncbi:retrovirus-related pol polyprotein from [Plakobranchus ocellatus]|uniref:Retrovirus-related pol polyprotein from n=1 Tax=Plakobranchus ocellatus TaxID=259542 RepID=A0AAV3YEZ5_9GAST|nr:retrovirus-related pol polyprotein from [Plakobranchus ocellatus]